MGLVKKLTVISQRFSHLECFSLYIDLKSGATIIKFTKEQYVFSKALKLTIFLFNYVRFFSHLEKGRCSKNKERNEKQLPEHLLVRIRV